MFVLALIAQTVRIAVPYALAALGGTITERSGMVDLALEAKLLFGAFAAAAISYETQCPYAGIVGAAIFGALVGLLQAYLALRLLADQVIVGVALNLLALGGTRFLLQIWFHKGANSPPAPGFGDTVVTNPIVWIAVIATIGIPLAVRHLRWGLRLRAAGDRPDALVAVGVSSLRTRMITAMTGGALAGIGGAQLALAVGGFSAGMSNGRGYIALAMVILAGWRPLIATLACIAVAGAEAIRIQLQLAEVPIPPELLSLLPYVLTLVVLVAFGGKRRPPPAALGKV